VKPAIFEELFELHFDPIYGYLARRLGADLAADLAAETFTRAFASRRSYDAARGDVRAWLFGIANNLVRRHYRDEERRLRALAQMQIPAGEPATEDVWIADALAALPGEERDVLLLFAWVELSYGEIAAVLEVPVGTVRSRLHRARAHVRAALQREEALDG
jgi:RNA polymerase sigma-70 factor (ECF subfamily)